MQVPDTNMRKTSTTNFAASEFTAMLTAKLQNIYTLDTQLS